jgi:hypothetical protein
MTESSDNDLSVKTVYPPVGYCIYCLRAKVKLTTEHTFPNGIGGRHELPKASCPECQREISKVEQYCLRTLLGNIRAHTKIRSSRKKPQPPTSVRVGLPGLPGMPRIYRPIEELPILLALPMWQAPKALVGLPVQRKIIAGQWTNVHENHRRAFQSFGVQSFFSEDIDHMKFARMLAKIGHSHAYATLDRDIFKPALVPLILGQTDHFIEFVGGKLEIEPAMPGRGLDAWFGTGRRRTDGKPFLVMTIRLFPSMGTPTYQVVVGELLKPLR